LPRASDFIDEHSTYVALPCASDAVVVDLLQNMHLAGYQKGKDRGTVQYTDLKQLMKSGGAFGKWFERCVAAVTCKGKIVNVFLNINSGEAGVEYGDVPGKKVWHKDKFSTLGDLVATGRLVVQLTRDDVEGSLGVQIGDEEVYIPIPAWTGLWADADILTKFFHRHGANGRCISFVFEVAEPQYSGLSLEDARMASAEQPSIEATLDEYLGDWNQAIRRFKGNPSKIGSGTGNARRLAVTHVAGPKVTGTKRKMAAAREEVEQMSPEELQRAAAAQAFGGQGVGSLSQAARASSRVDALSPDDRAKLRAKFRPEDADYDAM